MRQGGGALGSYQAGVVKGEFYWDGGLVPNTPLAQILSATPRRNNSSRTRAITDMMESEQKYRRLLRDLLKHMPHDALQGDDHQCQVAQEMACSHQYNVIQLIYRDKEWDRLSKDDAFGPITMRDHWASGLADIGHTLTNKAWLELPPEGKEFITHDFRRSARPAGAAR
ncbi:DUF3734 domain-containing protein [Aquabacterium sp.]|uniref:DUF3734 domain-containing protein n=1 Tax=Aquabacterium sp. TaxID=1872578 RepID=UPI0019C5A81C|nr:DUF3734 domain-containing protein [Aquabacterium sp.]MBC7700739.1 DUF3734 domain-containing protein [Aquabacterium sp.]